LDEFDDETTPLPRTSYRQLLAADAALTPATVAAPDLMSIVYTSGTTGFAKGCMLSHGYYMRVGRVMVEALGMSDDDVLFTALPLFHGAARMMVVAAGLVRGIPVVVEPAFSAS